MDQWYKIKAIELYSLGECERYDNRVNDRWAKSIQEFRHLLAKEKVIKMLITFSFQRMSVLYPSRQSNNDSLERIASELPDDYYLARNPKLLSHTMFYSINIAFQCDSLLFNKASKASDKPLTLCRIHNCQFVLWQVLASLSSKAELNLDGLFYKKPCIDLSTLLSATHHRITLLNLHFMCKSSLLRASRSMKTILIFFGSVSFNILYQWNQLFINFP